MSAQLDKIRQDSRDRLVQLAKHKKPITEWWTSVGPRRSWGTQDMMWPIPQSATTAVASERIERLATPKTNFQSASHHYTAFLYSCGQPSMIGNVSHRAMKSTCTPRVEELAKSKRNHPEYVEDRPQFYLSCGRQSAIWTVDDGAKVCKDRPHTVALAQPKPYPADFLPAKEIQTIVALPALNAKPSDRTESLASPREKNAGPFRNPQWQVTKAAMNSSASARSMELARAKGTVDGFQLDKEMEWPITRAAKRAVPSSRVDELAHPIVRASMDHVQFNPDAFTVRVSALKGIVPRRIEELSQPIQRD